MSRSSLPLKERLAALAAKSTTQGQHSPASGTTPGHGRRRSLFSPPWVRRPSVTEAVVVDKMQEVMGRLIYQAGVDYETRPMVVVNASALPDPHEVSYDLLLSRILAYLNLYVESDYTVVFFAAGGRHTPGWNWIWKAYRSLGRSYRKNLKSLYIVHSSFFTKMLFSLAGALISPKFFRKIEYINSLSELAYYVPLTQIDIPPAVYQENMKHETEIRLPVPMRRDVFGVPLEELMGWDGEKGGVPRVIRDAVQFLREGRLEDEGIFRRSPSSALLRQVQEAYDRGHVVNLETFGDSHLAAVLIKKYLRDLPEPIFPESLYPVIRRCPPPSGEPGDVASVIYIREVLLPQLPHCAYVLLSYIMQLLHEVSLHADLNKMDATNLTIVVGPNMLKSANPLRDVQMCAINTSSAEGTTLGTVLMLCISRYYECFEEVHDRADTLVRADSPALSSHSSNGAGMQDSDWALVSASGSGSASGSWTRSTLAASASSLHDHEGAFGIGDADEDEDDEEDDRVQHQNAAGGPPSAWGGAAAPWKRHKSTPSRGSSTSRLSSASASTRTGSAPSTLRTRARSAISVEKGSPGTMRGSISVGSRGSGGTVRSKSSGSGVEAVGITAAGFFTAPEDAPAVPGSVGQ